MKRTFIMSKNGKNEKQVCPSADKKKRLQPIRRRVTSKIKLLLHFTDTSNKRTL